MIAVDTSVGRLFGRGSFVAGSDVVVACGPSALPSTSPATTWCAPSCATSVFQGSKVQLHFASAEADRLLVETADLPGGLPAPGTAMQLAWSRGDTLIYPAT